jgi:hypothetical protein
MDSCNSDSADEIVDNPARLYYPVLLAELEESGDVQVKIKGLFLGASWVLPGDSSLGFCNVRNTQPRASG